MLQYVTAWPCDVAIADQVKGVISGGCRWVELSAPGMTEDELRAVAREIIPVCREADAFVIMRDHRHLAGELRLGGIFLDRDSGEDPRQVRQQLGGEAVIGVEVTTAEQIRALRGADIDYAVIAVTGEETAQAAIAAVTEVRAEGVKMPVVAMGAFSLEEMRALLGVGFSGIALSAVLAEAPDIAEATRMVLAALAQE